MNFSCSASLRSRPCRSRSRRLLRHLQTLLQPQKLPNPNQTNLKRKKKKFRTQLRFFSINHLALALILIEIRLRRRRRSLPPLCRRRRRIAIRRRIHKTRSPALLHLAGVGPDKRRRRGLRRGGGPIPI